MRIVKQSCPHLKNAKRVIVSDRYILVLTGKSLLILNRSYELLQTVSGLNHVYNGVISPDGKKLLLISNGNQFYVISLDTLELEWKCRVKKDFNGNLEGRGCWSQDGSEILLVVMNEMTLEQRIRHYNSDDPNQYYDDTTLSKCYWINGILSIPPLNAYYVLAQDKLDLLANMPGSRPITIACYDGKEYEHFVIEEQRGIPQSMEYHEELNRFTVYCMENVFSCDPKGQSVRRIDVNESFVGDQKLFPPLSTVKQLSISKNNQYVFMASTLGFEVFEKTTGDLLGYQELSFGAENLTELEENLVVVCGYSGNAMLYKIL